jgi:predicted dithiol-disulfide oxidoreductase (DUF899 family)
MSAFVLENGVVYRAYPSYSHGVGALWGIYQWLDRAFSGGAARPEVPPR